jgi:hypothetical protein
MGGICRGVLCILRVRIWCTSAPIPLLAAAVLCLGAASSDSFGDPAYCGLHNLVRGLHRDRTPLQLVELLLLHPTLVGPRPGGSDVELRSCLYPPRAGCRPVLPPLSIQPAGRMAGRVALPTEQCQSTAPGGYR